MKKTTILTIISLLVIYSCSNSSTTQPNSIQPSNNESISPSPQITENATITPYPLAIITPTATPSPLTYSCLGFSDYRKTFSIKCQYFIIMLGTVRDKSNSKGLKSSLKLENENKSYTIETDDKGYYEIRDSFGFEPYERDEIKGTITYKFKITVSSEGYKNLTKEVLYKTDGSLNTENPINFELEVF